MATTKPKCYDCEYIAPIPGDEHIKCNCSKPDLKIKGDVIGIESGWFDWPYNFDPVWLIQCNGFKKRG